MRTTNSIKNSISSFLCNLFSLVITFFSQAMFIRILGAEYLGLNGLFSNILNMLCLFELGIGNAIVFNLYKPIAINDFDKISSLMNFYRKAYKKISICIFIVGLLLIPFLNFLVGNISININIYIVYFLFLLCTISSYFLAYKRSLIIAYQKNYVINIFHLFYLLFVNIFQITIIYFTKNYYYYLIIKIICLLLENFAISIFANYKYKNILSNKTSEINKNTENDIFKKIKALFFHKIGSIIVLGTDNIIISKFFGVLYVGIYSNYSLIINGVNTIFSQIITSTTSSIGNLLSSSSQKKNFEVFEKIRFLNTWISIFTSVSILLIVQTFISIWVGPEYKLKFSIVIVIIFNFFQKMQRIVYNTFKDSAGIWVEDKYIPLLESLINIVSSIIFLYFFGLAGVFLGTIFSGLIIWLYSYPKFVYKKLFGRSYKQYILETLKSIILFILISVISLSISNLLYLNNLIIYLVINTTIALVIPNFILFILYKNDSSYIFFISLIKKIFKSYERKKI